MHLDYWDSSLFDWLTWRSGTPLDLGIARCRYDYIIRKKETIKKYAIGYCNGESSICRPKNNHKAVMFYKDDTHFWFHLTDKEFEEVFIGRSNVCNPSY
jgi:hypothetical protein